MKAEKKYLDVVFYDNTSYNRDISVRDFLKGMLLELWYEGEGFSGKRPFGNSCWEFPLIYALVEAEAIKGTMRKVYDDGELIEVDCRFDNKEVWAYVGELIEIMCSGE
ncbi:hypothetical protein D9M71_682640 [compost metagenome]